MDFEQRLQSAPATRGGGEGRRGGKVGRDQLRDTRSAGGSRKGGRDTGRGLAPLENTLAQRRGRKKVMQLQVCHSVYKTG
jgi:hypothetical protein